MTSNTATARKRTTKEAKRSNLRWNMDVLEGILFNAGPKIPLEERDVLTELANAAVEYLTGKEGQLGYGGAFDNNVEIRVEKYFKMMLESKKGEFTPTIGKAIDQILACTFQSDWDSAWLESGLHLIFELIRSKELRCGGCSYTNAFSLSESTRSKISYSVLSEFPVDELMEIKELGKLMQKYIARDLAAVERQSIRNL